MGQSSIPVLNRVGTSVFWGSVWSNKHDYLIFFKDDLFLRKFIDSIFLDKISSKFELSYNSKKIFKTQYKVDFDLKRNLLVRYLRRFNKIPFFYSVLYIVRLGCWVIIFVVVCNVSLSKLKKKTNINFFKNQFFLQKNYNNADYFLF